MLEEEISKGEFECEESYIGAKGGLKVREVEQR